MNNPQTPVWWFQIKVTEERRLAVTVHLIDEEVSVVPRGAFNRTHLGLMNNNRCFEGTLMSVGFIL
jgi:uncharacterized protein YjiK